MVNVPLYVCVCVYIYIEREREREIQIYIYLYISISCLSRSRTLCIFPSVSSSVSFISILQFSVDSIISTTNSDNLTSYSLPIQISFIVFSCLLSVVKISNTVLSKTGERGQHFLVPDLRGNSFKFILLSMILAIGFSHMAFIMLWYISSMLTF